jgi:hypothetical protein
MNPTLKTGDLLHLAPYGKQAIRRGDVIVFRHTARANAVTHRVVTIFGDVLETRGDNNDGIDPWMVSRDSVLGRVTSITRSGRLRTVRGGLLGRIRGSIVGLQRLTRQKLVGLLKPTYRRVAAWGVFRWTARRMETRIVSFRRPGMPPELHLHLAGRVIGRLLPGEQHWRITPPFRLLIDADSLPSNEIESTRSEARIR